MKNTYKVKYIPQVDYNLLPIKLVIAENRDAAMSMVEPLGVVLEAIEVDFSPLSKRG